MVAKKARVRVEPRGSAEAPLLHVVKLQTGDICESVRFPAILASPLVVFSQQTAAQPVILATMLNPDCRLDRLLL